MLRTAFFLALFAGLPALGIAAANPEADTLRTPSGVRYVLREAGQGKPAGPSAAVRVNYTGFLPNGKFFDSSATDGRPIRVKLGKHEVIQGWEELLPLLPEGARVWARIPAELAYGAKGARDPDDDSKYRVPPNTDLVFELEIVRIN
ncbi:FKBP-type peptidyl-prolyl cis-trans isomerase [Solirubrum puertoriconensis]|uniref:FKBP-type peptidyl-prolyl cis-trans isomerase n=1 Tax=Solirubrum puertoriconensis TaxID=1751427 RepID=UPI0009901895|nr:FKBP-type peptidyl-prolyl cis-trans isomerase [Solirubrum puertoriconensis]